MDIDQLFARLKQLPVIPQLLHELMESFQDENARIDDIASKIIMDQGISARVLKMANSAAYRRGKEVTSIEQAVIRLGFNAIRSLVVASGIAGAFKTPSSFDKRAFWTNTFQVATIAKALAQHTDVEPETAFTSALMHNIGEILIQTAAPEEAELIALSQQQGASRVEAQNEMLGFNYTDVGVELARRWTFSDTFTNAIDQQLDPLSHEEVSKEAVLIRLAVFVNFAWNAGVPAQIIVDRFPGTLASHLNIDPTSLVNELENLQQQGNELAAMLG